MKSICIKTNNSNYLEYLLSELKNSDFKNIYFSENQFKLYKNIIIHYKGINYNDFFAEISSFCSLLVIDEVEKSLFNKLLIQNYFYFDLRDRKEIIEICFELLSSDFAIKFNEKYNLLYNSFFDFISNNKVIFLDGFINFRIKDYISFLDKILQEAIDIFILEKEYLEFISLLKLYINSTPPLSNIVYLIYFKDEPILLDENKNILKITTSIEKAKYLSDISFSSNDYVLNTLLNLLPKTIYLELLDNNYPHEFINTLSLVFDDRLKLLKENSNKILH